MPKRRIYRLEVTPDAYQTAEAEAFLSGKTLKTVASEIILSHSSEDAKGISRMKSQKIIELKCVETKKPNDQEIKCGMSNVDEKRQKKRNLAHNPDALSRIKELWKQTPRPSIMQIAKDIGFPKATTAENIRAMKKRGELQE